MSSSGELKPISDYINNKEEMIEQMFMCVEEHQLNRMIPDCLKGVPLHELKADCLVQLLGMSTKRILSVMAGHDLNESSSSSDDDVVLLSDISDSDDSILNRSDGGKRSKSSIKSGLGDSEDSSGSTKRRHKSKKKTKVKKPKTSQNKEESKKKEPKDDLKKEGKTLLEILELEMRARAIRALLNKEMTLPDNIAPTVEIEDDDPEAVIPIEDKVEVDLTVDSDEDVPKTTEKSTPPSSTIQSTQPESIILINDDDKSNESTDKTDGPILDLCPTDSEVVALSPQPEVENRKNGESQKTNNNQSSDVENMSWAKRWLESKDVKKVIATSKILTTTRRKVKGSPVHEAKTANNTNSPQEVPQDAPEEVPSTNETIPSHTAPDPSLSIDTCDNPIDFECADLVLHPNIDELEEGEVSD